MKQFFRTILLVSMGAMAVACQNDGKPLFPLTKNPNSEISTHFTFFQLISPRERIQQLGTVFELRSDGTVVWDQALRPRSSDAVYPQMGGGYNGLLMMSGASLNAFFDHNENDYTIIQDAENLHQLEYVHVDSKSHYIENLRNKGVLAIADKIKDLEQERPESRFFILTTAIRSQNIDYSFRQSSISAFSAEDELMAIAEKDDRFIASGPSIYRLKKPIHPGDNFVAVRLIEIKEGWPMVRDYSPSAEILLDGAQESFLKVEG